MLSLNRETNARFKSSASGSGNLTEASAIATSSAATDSSKSVEASSEFLHNMQPQPSASEEPAFPPTYEEAISTYTKNASSTSAYNSRFR